MRILGMLCCLTEGDDSRLMIVGAEGEYIFLNRDELPGEMGELAEHTEASGTVSVLGAVCEFEEGETA